MTNIDLNPPRYTNGVTRNTVKRWLEWQQLNKEAGIQMPNMSIDRIIDLCLSWLDIEQQLAEAKEKAWRYDELRH